MKKLLCILVSSFTFFLFSASALADAAPGDVIVFFGDSLTIAQKNELLKEMNVPQGSLEIGVTNAEEHRYLGEYIPKATIGTKAISSGKITIGEKDSGIVVKSNNINWVKEEMFTNALITAGVKDAEIYITAPFSVSGTAALTGLLKAYETSTGEEIPEEQKQVANEEMVETAKLAEQLGETETNSLMTTIKENMAEGNPATKKEIQQVITDSAAAVGVTLTDAQFATLTSLFEKMKEQNIDWNQVGEQLNTAKEKFDNFIQSEEAKGMWEAIVQFFTNLIEIIKSWFN